MSAKKQDNSSASSLLSPHLFWDVDKENIEWEKVKKRITNEVSIYFNVK